MAFRPSSLLARPLEETLEEHCWCGTKLGSSSEQMICTVCQRPCCPACAFELTSGTYCTPCAETRSW